MSELTDNSIYEEDSWEYVVTTEGMNVYDEEGILMFEGIEL